MVILEYYEGDTEALDEALMEAGKRKKKVSREVARLNRALGVA